MILGIKIVDLLIGAIVLAMIVAERLPRTTEKLY